MEASPGLKKNSILRFGLVSAAILMAGFATGCSQTVSEQPAVIKQVEGGQAPTAITGFFGADYSKLQPGSEGQAAMVYLNPNANWSQYNKIMLQPVEFWDSGNSGVSPSDQQMLTSYAYNQLKQDLEKYFTMVDQPGPGVMVMRTALLGATGATPGLRSVSVVIPQVRILNAVQSMATGSYAFVGSAEGEMKITDATTGEFLGGAIDKRVGGAALSSAAQWRWGDAQNAMNYWAEKTTNRLLELQGRKPAAQ